MKNMITGTRAVLVPGSFGAFAYEQAQAVWTPARALVKRTGADLTHNQRCVSAQERRP
ncbi:MAG: hypothetical protein H0W01_16955 [Pseudonocardiales bacterium]|nr:hypothetical protein [Pseudonocardiales bacterium]